MRVALLGCGYAAAKHLKAISSINGWDVVLACDVHHDVVGILDTYAPDCRFVREEPLFWDRCLDDVDVVAVATPNHLHVAHATRAMRAGCDVILEKPVALRFADVQDLIQTEGATGQRVYPVLQLRTMNTIRKCRAAISHQHHTSRHCDITYHVYRGDWYHQSWKGEIGCSGGILFNLGVHLFDACTYLFGDCTQVNDCRVGEQEAGGIAVYAEGSATTTVNWHISSCAKSPCRRFVVAHREVSISGEMDAHTEQYRAFARGERVSLLEAAKAISTCERVVHNARRWE